MSTESSTERLFWHLVSQNRNTSRQLFHLHRQYDVLEQGLVAFDGDVTHGDLQRLMEAFVQDIEDVEASMYTRNLERRTAAQREYWRLTRSINSYQRNHGHFRGSNALAELVLDILRRAPVRTLNTQYGQISGPVPSLLQAFPIMQQENFLMETPPARRYQEHGPVFDIDSMIHDPYTAALPNTLASTITDPPSYVESVMAPQRQSRFADCAPGSPTLTTEEISFNPPLLGVQHPPRYQRYVGIWQNFTAPVGQQRDQRSELSSSSDDQIYRPELSNHLLYDVDPLIPAIRHLSASFHIDPRTRHTSRGAQTLGIMRQASESLSPVRTRGDTLPEIRRPDISTNFEDSPVLRRRQSLEMIADPENAGVIRVAKRPRREPLDSRPRQSYAVASGQAAICCTAARLPHGQSLPIDDRYVDHHRTICTNREIQLAGHTMADNSESSVNSRFPQIGTIIPGSPFGPIVRRSSSSTTILLENGFSQPTAAIESDEDLTEISFTTPEFLEYAHEFKYAEDMSNRGYHHKFLAHEQDMHAEACRVWLRNDACRRGSRFRVLSIEGDESMLAYYGSDYASSESSDENVSNPQSKAHLRGGFTPINRLPFGSSPSPPATTFINSRGNEYFCDIDEEYLTDRFNLTSLNTEVQYYQYALDLVTDMFDLECDDEMREQIEKSARHLYGLVHARYIVTTRGLQKMCEKFKNGDFGKCPRVACDGQHLLPMGQNDTANVSAVKLYCARCEDLYNPKSSRHASVDGAYFGTSFHNMFLQVYPNLMPPKTQRRYEPRVFGFRVHAAATLARWQTEQREKMKARLVAEGLDTGFEEEERDDEMEESEGEEEVGGIDDMFEGQRVVPPGL